MPTSDTTIDDLKSARADSNITLLDIRPIAAYNGWALENEPRGGHIKGAKTFPAHWTGENNWPQLLLDKGVNRDRPVIVYGYDEPNTATMAAKLKDAGWTDVRTFNGFMDWSKDNNRPMDFLPRYDRLVYPEWVQQLIDGYNPPTHKGGDAVICHASYRYRGDYEAGHIPGAIHLDTELLESSKTWNRHEPEKLKRALQSLGIRRDTTVVCYGRFNHPNNREEYPGRLAGHLAAIRCAQILLYCGVEDVRILNGGMVSWRAEGREMSTDEAEVRPADDFGANIPQHPELIVDTPEAKQLLAADDGALVSVRSWEEFIGNTSGYNYFDQAGRIPGAVFGDCGSDAYHMENYRNCDQTLREFHEIAATWAEKGITPDKHCAFYCGTGWRASEAFLHAWLMNWPRVSVYDGGWYEWSADPANPLETGIPEGVGA